MNTIEVLETGTVLHIPENGTEFTRAQFLALSKLMLYYNAKAITYDQFRVKLVYEFLNLVRTVDITDPQNGRLVENISEIAKLVDGYFYEEIHEGKKVKALHMLHYNQLIPVIIVEGKKFYGPSSALLNTKYGEYMQALAAFTDYSYTGDEKQLNRLLAILYRPEKQDNDPENQKTEYTADNRRKFSPELTDHYSKILSRVAPQVKLAVYLFFASCQHFIANCTSLDIGGGNTIDLSILYKKAPSSSTAKGLGMVGTLYAIAETKVFGTAKEAAEQDTYDILAFLVKQHNDMEELKKKKK